MRPRRGRERPVWKLEGQPRASPRLPASCDPQCGWRRHDRLVDDKFGRAYAGQGETGVIEPDRKSACGCGETRKKDPVSGVIGFQ